jgi:RNA polymerase sigma-70 factor (ECF subfamily)
VEDESLVAGTLAGRPECFEALVERHQRSIHGLAHRWLGDHAAADEVVQATFVQAYTHLVDFRGEASFRSWLCGIALNQARTLQRIRRRERSVPLDEVPEEALPRADEPPAAGENHRRLALLVQRLPPRQRAVVNLRVAADLPFKEIARIEGISENSAKVSYHHAVTRLRQWMGRG